MPKKKILKKQVKLKDKRSASNLNKRGIVAHSQTAQNILGAFSI